MVGFVGQRTVNRDDIAAQKQLLQSHLFDKIILRTGLLMTAEGDHLHTESRRHTGGPQADASKADDSYGLLKQLNLPALHPQAAADSNDLMAIHTFFIILILKSHIMADIEQQSHGKLSNGHIPVNRIRHGNVMFLCRFPVKLPISMGK